MWKTLSHLRVFFILIACSTFMNCRPAGFEAQDGDGVKLLSEPRIVDAPLDAGAVRLAISSDGKRFAVAGTADRETNLGQQPGQQHGQQSGAVAYLFETDTGKQIARLELADLQNYNGWRQVDLAFSPDGKSLATVSAATVQFWDPATGRQQFTLTKSDSSFDNGHISFSPNGKLLAVSRGNKALEIWDVAAKKKSQTIPVSSESASAFPDNESLLTAEHHNRVHLWKLSNVQELAEFHAMMGILRAVEIAPDGKLAAIAGVGGFKLLDISSEAPYLRERRELRGQLGEGGSVSFARKQNLLATAGMEGTVRLWDSQKGVLVGLLWWPEANERVAAVLSPDGELLVVSRFERSLGGRIPNRITEIYPVAELRKPDYIERTVLAAAESLFRAAETDQARGSRDQRAVTIAMSALDGAHAKPAVPLLLGKLKSEHVEVRRTALQVLAGIGPEAKEALPAIRALAKDEESETVKYAAHLAIAVIEGREIPRGPGPR